MALLTVKEAAESLALSRGRVRMLIHAGSLEAARIGSQYVIADEELARFVALPRHAHVRSFGRSIAWAAADLADGGSASFVSASERSRLRSRMDRESADLSAWFRRMRALSDETVRCTISTQRLGELLADRRGVRSGSFATNLVGDRLASSQGTLWVSDAAVLGELRRDYGLLRSSDGSVTCRIAGSEGWHFRDGVRDAFRLVVVADLVAEGDVRSRAAASALLQQTIKERSWREH